MLYEDTSKPVPGLAEILTSTKKKEKELKKEPRESAIPIKAGLDADDVTKPLKDEDMKKMDEDNGTGNGECDTVTYKFNNRGISKNINTNGIYVRV